MRLSAVVGHRRQTHQGDKGVTAQYSEFGQLGQERKRRDGTDTAHRGQKRDPADEVFVGGDESIDQTLKASALRNKMLHHHADALLLQYYFRLVASGFLAGCQVHDLMAAPHQRP